EIEGQQLRVVVSFNVNAITETGTASVGTVADAPLTAGTVTTVTGGIENTTAAALSATFTDANHTAPTSDFSGTISWGDGQTSAFTSGNVTTTGNGTFTVSGLSHVYAEEGTTGVTVTITDVGGSKTTDTGSTTVADAALTAGTVTTVTGGIENTTAAARSEERRGGKETGPSGDLSRTNSWGDGQTSAFTSGNVTTSGNGTFTVSGLSHVYAEEGTTGVTVTITDVGGSKTTDTGSTTVADAALTAGTVTTVTGGIENTTAAALSATFTDANHTAPTSDFSGTIS